MKNTWFRDWGEWGKGCVTKEGVATLSCAPIIFLNIVSALLAFVGLTALIMAIIGGYKFMNAAGDPKALEGARKVFIYGIIGIMIVLFSFVLMNIISIITNVPCIRTFGFGCPTPTPTPLSPLK